MNNYCLSGKKKLLLTCFFNFFLIAFSFLKSSLVFGQLSCPNGELTIDNYVAISSPTQVLGSPDNSNYYYSGNTPLVLEYAEEFTEGAIITFSGYYSQFDEPLTIEFGNSNTVFNTTKVVTPIFPEDVMGEVTITVPNGVGIDTAAGYKWLRLVGKGWDGFNTTRIYLDAVKIKTTKCNPCTAGAEAPSFLTNPTASITGQATFDLSTFDATVTNKGTKNVKWYYFLPASVDSEIPNGTQVLSGKYYAAFEGDDNGSPCYSDATEFTIISDFDGDSIIDDIDIDDDNDGILDKFECTTDLTSSGSFEYDHTVTTGDFNGTWGIEKANDDSFYTVHLEDQMPTANPNIGQKDDWIFHESVDWTQGQYIVSSNQQANDYHPTVKQSITDGGAFIIFSLNNEAISNNLTGLTIGENYEFTYEMGFLPRYSDAGSISSYAPSTYVDITGGDVLTSDDPDFGAYAITDFPSTVSKISQPLDPNWKVYMVIFKATSTSVNVKLGTNSSDVVTIDAVKVVRFPIDPICTRGLNTDADGDGCDDGTEAGLIALTPAEIAMGVGVNGLYDALETSVDSGILKDPIDLTTNPYDKDKQGSDCSSSDPCTIGATLGTVTPNDPDADGINNVCDLDDDNDGISDTVENINNKNPDTDADADGIPLYLDDDDTNAAIGDVNNNIEADFDTDNDGIPNHLDLDADNDGIYDVVEAGGTDTNNDGKADHSGADYSDTAGFPDSTFFGLTPTNTNTITDNPADFLNIDSDGDGCSDANEAYGNANTDTNSDGTYGEVITSAEVDANGLVTDAAYSAPNANYTTVSYINSVCYIDICTDTAGTDTDNDGVKDICDVDIDNDGILNENENCNSPVWGTAPLTWTTADDSGTIALAGGIDMSIDITTTASGDLDASGGTALNLSATGAGTLGTLDDLGIFFNPDATQGTSPVKIQIDFTEKMYNLNFKITDIDAGGFGVRIDKVTITSDIGNPILTKVSETSSSFTVANNQATAIRYVTSDKDNKGTILVQVPDGAKSITIIYEEVGTASDPGVRGIGILGDLKYCLDTDNDGTPDSNDLDSDNDGCPDAVEANENVTSAQLDANKRIDIANQGGVDTNGVPNLVNSGGTADGSNNTQGQGTNTAVLTATKIEVKTQPTNKVICLGGNAVFTAEMLSKSTTIFNAGVPDYTGITGNTIGLVYQWEEQIEGAGSWNVISNGGIYSNATTASLTLTNPLVTASTNKYRLVTTSTSNTCAEVISSEVEIVVNACKTIATDDNFSGNEDAGDITGNVITGNNGKGVDSDSESDPLTIESATVDANGDGTPTALTLGTPTVIKDASNENIGTITLNTNGDLVFAPETNYNGTVPTINYVVTDGTNTDDADVVIRVTAVNDTFDDLDETSTGLEEATQTGNVLDGKTVDTNGLPLSVTDFSIGTQTGTVGSALTIANVGTIQIDANGAYEFIPVANYNGDVPAVNYTVSNTETTNDSKLDIKVTAVNDTFDDLDETSTGLEEATQTGNVLDGKTVDTNGLPLSVTDFSIGTQTGTVGSALTIANVGTIQIDANGAYEFIPVANYNGDVPAVNYTVSNTETTNDSKLDIKVTAVDDETVIKDDTATTDEEVAVTIDVLKNDTDVDGNTATLVSATNGTNGTTSIVNGKIVYTPNENFHGVDTFTYTNSEGNTATVKVTVNPINDVFTDENETETIDEGATLNDSVLTGTTSADGVVTVKSASVDINGDGTPTALTIGTPTVIKDDKGNPIGTITLNADGTYKFEAATDYNGTVPTVNYTLTDGSGDDVNSTLDIKITPKDDAFTDENETETIDEGATLNDSVLTGTTSADGVVTVKSASVDINGDGTPTALTIGTPTVIKDDKGNPIGTITLNADGTYKFEAATDYNG
ncbi:beta strand repeat-containing protein, partial [Tenacibaculum finnmarkense]|uniref:beta strand repeat-containing protein n=6 Tax=Tenacibaculum finnmarkense TaxID=2781243 RepID=UPI001E5DFAFF